MCMFFDSQLTVRLKKTIGSVTLSVMMLCVPSQKYVFYGRPCTVRHGESIHEIDVNDLLASASPRFTHLRDSRGYGDGPSA